MHSPARHYWVRPMDASSIPIENSSSLRIQPSISPIHPSSHPISKCLLVARFISRRKGNMLCVLCIKCGIIYRCVCSCVYACARACVCLW